MGLAALRKVLDPQPCTLDELSDQSVAVDANNLLWTFVTGMARGGAPTGPHGRPISHVIGLVNRLTLYAEHGISSIWVYDGKQPTLKEDTIAERQARIEAAREAGDEVAATQLEHDQIRESQAILDALGVPWVQAPAEGDAQCAWLIQAGHAQAAVTQDYDAALHGCPVTYRNVKATGKRGPERMDLEAALERQRLNHQQLVDAAILIGTDYNDGIHGVGPVTALKLVRQHGDLFGALEAKGVKMPQASAIRALFLDHPVDDRWAPVQARPEREHATTLLAEHGISRTRANRLVGALSGLR